MGERSLIGIGAEVLGLPDEKKKVILSIFKFRRNVNARLKMGFVSIGRSDTDYQATS